MAKPWGRSGPKNHSQSALLKRGQLHLYLTEVAPYLCVPRGTTTTATTHSKSIYYLKIRVIEFHEFFLWNWLFFLEFFSWKWISRMFPLYPRLIFIFTYFYFFRTLCNINSIIVHWWITLQYTGWPITNWRILQMPRTNTFTYPLMGVPPVVYQTHMEHLVLRILL